MVTQEIAPVRREEKESARPQAVRRRRQAGFTLIEMLAVVVILAIVAGVGFVVVNNQIEKARENTDVANLRTIGDAVNRYIMEHPGDVSTNLTGNLSGSDNPAKALIGAYLGVAPTDPWNSGDPYTLIAQGNSVIITSPHTYPTGYNAPPGYTLDNSSKLTLTINY